MSSGRDLPALYRPYLWVRLLLAGVDRMARVRWGEWPGSDAIDARIAGRSDPVTNLWTAGSDNIRTFLGFANPELTWAAWDRSGTRS